MAARIPSVPHELIVPGFHTLRSLEFPDLLSEGVVDARGCDGSAANVKRHTYAGIEGIRKGDHTCLTRVCLVSARDGLVIWAAAEGLPYVICVHIQVFVAILVAGLDRPLLKIEDLVQLVSYPR